MKKKLVIAAVCLVLIVGAGAFWVLGGAGRGPGDSLALDDNATMGVLPGIDIDERKKQLQEQLDEGMIAFSINSSPAFATGGTEGNLMLENPANNAKLLVVEIYIDSTGELVYQSKAIPPGAYIETARLDKVLEPGEYPATAYFKAYRREPPSRSRCSADSGRKLRIQVLLCNSHLCGERSVIFPPDRKTDCHCIRKFRQAAGNTFPGCLLLSKGHSTVPNPMIGIYAVKALAGGEQEVNQRCQD